MRPICPKKAGDFCATGRAKTSPTRLKGSNYEPIITPNKTVEGIHKGTDVI